MSDEVLRVAAAANCPVERVTDLAGLRASWQHAPVVIIDPAVAANSVRFALPRRESVVVVCTGVPPPSAWPDAVALGAADVISLPERQTRLVDVLADAAERPAARRGRAVAVVGGRGGAGASVLAAAIGLTVINQGDDALLVDCDPLGGGLDLLLGAEHTPGLRWPEVRMKSGRIPASSLREALPSRTSGAAHLSLLSGARTGDGPSPDAVAAVMDAGKRAGKTVVCDLPRTTDAAAGAALDRADLAVIVVPAEVPAVASARRIAAAIATRGVRTVSVIRRPSPTGLPSAGIAEMVGLPLLAVITPDRAVPKDLDRGGLRPRRSLERAAQAVLADLLAQ